MAPGRSKPSDHFTRFTSATPHASSFQTSSPSLASSRSSPPSQSSTSRRLPSNGPPGETPTEKVARLRAAHRAAQEAAAYSPMDRVIARGRFVADKLHRGAAYTLMGFTVVAGGLAVYSFFSLMSHHRRQKRAWLDRELERLRDAQTAFLSGTANAEQLHLLEQERAGEEMKIAAQAERSRTSLWGKTKRMFYSIGGGVKEEESMGENVRRGEYGGIMDMVREKEQGQRILTDGEPQVEIHSPSSPSEAASAVTSEIKSKINPSRVGGSGGGGILDQMADNAFSAGTSWFRKG